MKRNLVLPLCQTEFHDGSHVLFSNMAPIFKTTKPRLFSTTLLSFKSIEGSVFELEFRNQNVNGQLLQSTYGS